MPTPRTNSRLHLAIIPLAALLAVLPLIVHGCSCGHDFDFHILSWMEAGQQLLHGHMPQWADTPAWNAGEPRFVFYPPLSWLIGALLGAILPWKFAPIAYTWLALTASGFTLHRLARVYAGPAAATLAAILYLANPYMLFTAYERTAYAELLAAAWMPLLLQAILAEEITVPAIALPVALLWLTNAPAGVMGCYALAFLGAIRLVQSPAANRLKLAARGCAGLLLGLCSIAFYLVPAAAEQKYVQVAMAVVPGMRIADNTLFHITGDGPHDVVLHTASIIAVILLFFTVTALVFSTLAPKARHPERSEGPPHSFFARSSTILSLSLLTLAIAVLLTPLALPIWQHAPKLAYLQFPWRILSVLAAIFGLAAAKALKPLHLKPLALTAVVLAGAAALILLAYRTFAQPCDPADTVEARLALFHSPAGTDPTDEYTPAPADNDSLKHADPPFWLVAPQASDAQPPQTMPGPAPRQLELKLPQPETLVLNLRAYPSWRVTRNGVPFPARVERADGLLALPLPAGPSTIAIAEAKPWQMPDRAAGDAISLVSLLLLAVSRRRRNLASSTLA